MKKNHNRISNEVQWIGLSLVMLLTVGCFPAEPEFYSISGEVAGLGGSETINVDLNGGAQSEVVFQNGPFAFPVQLEDGTPYAVTTSNVAAGRICTVTGGENGDGTGTIAGADVTDILVECEDLTIADALANVADGLDDCIIANTSNPPITLVKDLTVLSCDASYLISDTTGLNQFVPLTSLSITNQAANSNLSQVSGLDALVNLVHLDLKVDFLSSIDLSENTLLQTLDLTGNLLGTINLDNNTALTSVLLDFNCWDGATLTYLSGLSFPTYVYNNNQNPNC